MRRRAPLLLVLALSGSALALEGPRDDAPAVPTFGSEAAWPQVHARDQPVLLGIDRDDDDGDGVVDSVDPALAPDDDDLLEYQGETIQVEVQGPLRILHAGRPIRLVRGRATIRRGDRLQAIEGGGEASLLAIRGRQPDASTALRVRPVRVEASLGEGSTLGADAGPCPFAPDERGDDPTSLVRFSAEGVARFELRHRRGERSVSASAARLVADDLFPLDDPEDVVRFVVALGDTIEASALDVNGLVRAAVRVGGAPGSVSRCAPRRIRASIHVVPADPSALSPAGPTRASIDANVDAVLADAERAFAPCGLRFGDPASVPRRRVDPPSASLLSIGEKDGLPAAGGRIRFRVDGHPIGPIEVSAGSTPSETASAIAAALRDAGFEPRVQALPRIDPGADAAADVIVRSRRRELVSITTWPGEALTTDTRQTLRLGVVDFADGLDEVDVDRARTGTLEERSLLSALVDADPGTIDVVVIERFASGTRMGEAFVPRDHSPFAGTVLLDRRGIQLALATYTLAHELAHVLLDDPFHPSATGDLSSRIMAADSGRAELALPRRFTRDECARMRTHGAAYLGIEEIGAPAISSR